MHQGLALASHLTISNTVGSNYVLLGVDTSSISSKANASDVTTKAEVNNKDNQSTTYMRTELNNALLDKLSQLTAGDPANQLDSSTTQAFQA